jgi:hypothetical protein
VDVKCVEEKDQMTVGVFESAMMKKKIQCKRRIRSVIYVNVREVLQIIMLTGCAKPWQELSIVMVCPLIVGLRKATSTERSE